MTEPNSYPGRCVAVTAPGDRDVEAAPRASTSPVVPLLLV